MNRYKLQEFFERKNGVRRAAAWELQRQSLHQLVRTPGVIGGRRW